MPKSQLELSIEKATNENNTFDDWSIIMEIVDIIIQKNCEKDAIKIISKRLNDKDPHIVMHTLTLLNACVKNCNKTFKLEVCSRTFIEELKQFILKNRFPKLSEKLCLMIQNWWKETDFQNDPALNLMPTLYLELKRNGIEFRDENNMVSFSQIKASSSKEDEDLEKAIQLSIKESQNFPPTKQIINNSSFSSNNKKVKALYDFEAVEDNEITFKAGDILFVLDSNDQNWWKGYDLNGKEGLFPSNFVTSDLNFEIENFEINNIQTKKVAFNEKVNVKLLDTEKEDRKKKRVLINEKKIDDCIDQLQNADPTGEMQHDTKEMLNLEEQCYLMGPIIDQQLQNIDYKHAILEDLNLKILEAFQMYNNLMKESINKTNTFIGTSYNNLPLISNFNTNLSNNIPFVAAPPQTESSAHSLVKKLDNFAPNNFNNLNSNNLNGNYASNDQTTATSNNQSQNNHYPVSTGELINPSLSNNLFSNITIGTIQSNLSTLSENNKNQFS